MNVKVSAEETHGHMEEHVGVEQTDLATLVKHTEKTQASAPLGQVYHQFQTSQQDFCAVLEGSQVVGLCSRGHVGFLMGHRYGFAIYSKVAVREHMVKEPLILRRGAPIRQVLEKALGRQGKEFNDDVILLGQEDEYLGIIPIPALVRLQSALVEERFRVQESMHKRMMGLSRQAGMAEVASGVLHNVGNVLNSVNVSATLAVDMVRHSKLKGLEKAASMLEKKRGEWGDFFSNDPKGKLLPDLFIQLAERMKCEHEAQLKELESLVKHLGHIKGIIAMQQRYAKVSGILELVPVKEMVEDALQMNADALVRHGVQLERRFEPVPPVMADRHKVLQILVNLIRNAKYAVDSGPSSDKTVVVGVEPLGQSRVKIVVQDNGVGIPPENLNRIFAHGFTTKKDGHGFGLHTSALAAKEMGGALLACSEGLGRGATFTLELPVGQASASA